MLTSNDGSITLTYVKSYVNYNRLKGAMLVSDSTADASSTLHMPLPTAASGGLSSSSLAEDVKAVLA